MGERPKIGVAVIQGRPFDELRRDWQAVDEAGLDSLWVFDHLMKYPIMGVLLEAYTTLAAMAVCTKRIRIGALVTNITFRNPAVLAKELVTIDHLSGGRVEIGIGAAGTRSDDALVTGSARWPLAERVERFEEFIELVKNVTRGAADYDGTYYRCENFDRGPWFVQQAPPITVAAHGRKTLRIAAKHADTWSASAGFGPARDDLWNKLETWNAELDDLTAGRELRRSLLIGPWAKEPWWESQRALDDFVANATGAGMTDLIFTYPNENERFLDLVQHHL